MKYLNTPYHFYKLSNIGICLVLLFIFFSITTLRSQETFTATNIKATNSFLLNSVENTPQIRLKVFRPSGPGYSGGVVNVGATTGSTEAQDPPDPCSLPNSNPWFMMNGGYITRANNGLVNASISMYAAPWNGSGYIESAGVNEVGASATALFLNYFCGRDLGLCLNTSLANGGGKVKVGNFLSAAQHVEIGDPTWGIASNNSPPNNIALAMHVNNGEALKIKTWNGALSMIKVENTGLTGSPTVFKVDGDGHTYIGIQKPLSTGPHANAMLAVDGKILAKEIFVNIHHSVWADYVFDKNYKLMPLYDLEKYIAKNKHLPNIPSASELTQDDEFSLNLADMQRKQLEKTEELFLYIIQQQKEIDLLKQQIKELKN